MIKYIHLEGKLFLAPGNPKGKSFETTKREALKWLRAELKKETNKAGRKELKSQQVETKGLTP